MQPPAWLFQRDEIDVLENELDDLWNRRGRKKASDSGEETVLKEYADSEDWAETDLLLRVGLPQEAPCTHDEEHHHRFETLPIHQFLRQELQRDALYAYAYEWARRVVACAQQRRAKCPPGTRESKWLFRAHVNALLVPVKLAFAQSGESHEGLQAKELARSDYALALTYTLRAIESLRDVGEESFVVEAEEIARAIKQRYV